MVLPRTAPSSWIQDAEFPSQLFDRGYDDYELFEEDGEFVLRIEMPGFDTEEITVAWDDGILNIGAQHEDTERGHQKTYHRRFRFPKHVDEAAIAAEYTNGVLEVRLPIEEGATVTGREIEVSG